MKQLPAIFFLLIALNANSQTQPSAQPLFDTTSTNITTRLGFPFGTIVTVEARIYDGNEMQMKAYEGLFLLQIDAVNGRRVKDTLLLRFIDETQTLASDDFELYKLTTGKTAKTLSGTQVDKMKKNYVGKKLVLITYETGHFVGIPNDYFKYRPIRADRGFHFEHYLIVVSNVTAK